MPAMIAEVAVGGDAAWAFRVAVGVGVGVGVGADAPTRIRRGPRFDAGSGFPANRLFLLTVATWISLSLVRSVLPLDNQIAHLWFKNE